MSEGSAIGVQSPLLTALTRILYLGIMYQNQQARVSPCRPASSAALGPRGGGSRFWLPVEFGGTDASRENTSARFPFVTGPGPWGPSAGRLPAGRAQDSPSCPIALTIPIYMSDWRMTGACGLQPGVARVADKLPELAIREAGRVENVAQHVRVQKLTKILKMPSEVR